MSSRFVLQVAMAAALSAVAGCGAETEVAGPHEDAGAAPPYLDAALVPSDARCVPTDAMCIVSACEVARTPTCQEGEWMCPPYDMHDEGCGAKDAGGTRGDAASGDAMQVAFPDAGVAAPDASAADTGSGEAGEPDAPFAGDAGIFPGDADSGVGCAETGCPPGYFCEEQGTEPVPLPPFVCVAVPSACADNPSCECLLHAGAYSCPDSFGGICGSIDAGLLVGCLAP